MKYSKKKSLKIFIRTLMLTILPLFNRMIIQIQKSSFSKMILLSLVLHIFIFNFLLNYLHLISSQFLDKKLKKKDYIQLGRVDKNRLKAPPLPDENIKSDKNNNIKKQVVNNELNGKKTPPKESRFLGEKNQTFDKQSIASIVDTFNKAGKGFKDGVTNQDFKKQNSKPQTTQTSPPTPVREKVINLADLKVQDNGDYLNNLKNIAKPPTKSSKRNEQPLDTPNQKTIASDNLAHDLEVEENNKNLGIEKGDALSKGLSRNNDFIEDVPLGETTNLNTSEFKFFGFYSRIRERLEQYWGSTLKNKVDIMYRSGKKLSPGKNYVTSLKITLDERGNIIKIIIMGASGFHHLDDAAIESFNKAGPFPNPPKEMVKNGPVVLEWGFVVKS